MLELTSDRSPAVLSSRYAVDERANRSLEVQSTCSTQEARQSADKFQVKTLCKGSQDSTYSDANQDHLDVAEHLWDTNQDVQHDGHQL
jgi:hypothetical protein